jgi:tRNA nucleotidyltransferase/poly(A) polymerase
MTTNATPEQILKIFPDGFYDNNFGTVGIPVEINNEKKVVEVTTFRTETGYADKRHPEKVAWGKTLKEDLSRRDFTINAIALKLGERDDFEYTDPYEGKKDLDKKIIRAVGDPNLRFKEDALRLLRAVRIATELGFTIENGTWEKITEDANLIQHISAERIRTELLRILASENPYEGIMLLKDSGLLQFILPELLEGVGVSQVRPGRHHKDDVFTHNVLALKFCPSVDPIIRFATLIHDAGKPRVATKDKEGLVIFHNHEVAGARMAGEICDRLKFSKKEKDKIVMLIRWHMFSVNENQTDAAIRRFIRKIGVENVKDMMDLRVGDRLGGGTQTAESWRLKLFKEKIEEQLKPAPFSINDMAVDGNDVMKLLNIKPGPVVGQILERLFAEVDEDLTKNNRDYLEKRIRELKESLLK